MFMCMYIVCLHIHIAHLHAGSVSVCTQKIFCNIKYYVHARYYVSVCPTMTRVLVSHTLRICGFLGGMVPVSCRNSPSSTLF